MKRYVINDLHLGHEAMMQITKLFYENTEIEGQDIRYINVCCEQIEYTPALLKDIINDNDTRN